MTRRRWKLVVLWSAAVVMGVVGAGAFVYQTARGAVEEEYRDFWVGGDPSLPEPEVWFKEVRFSRESWVVIEFTVQLMPEEREANMSNIEEWGLHEWDLITPSIPLW